MCSVPLLVPESVFTPLLWRIHDVMAVFALIYKTAYTFIIKCNSKV